MARLRSLARRRSIIYSNLPLEIYTCTSNCSGNTPGPTNPSVSGKEPYDGRSNSAGYLQVRGDGGGLTGLAHVDPSPPSSSVRSARQCTPMPL